MKQVLKDIQTGEYAKSFIIENRAGAPTLMSRRRLMAEHPIEVVGEKLRAMMPWIKKNRLVDQIAQLSAALRDRPPGGRLGAALRLTRSSTVAYTRPCTTARLEPPPTACGASAARASTSCPTCSRWRRCSAASTPS